MGHAQSWVVSVSLGGGFDSGACAPGPADATTGRSGVAIGNKQARRFIADASNVVDSCSYHGQLTPPYCRCPDDAQERNGV